MVKILLFADTHLGFDHPVRKVSMRSHRGEDFFHNFQLILDYAVNNQVDLLLHGGDFFYRSKVPAAIVTKAYEMLFALAESGIPTVIVPGNHETSFLPASILTRHPNIYIFSEARRFHLVLKGNNFDLYGFPFIRTDVGSIFPDLVKALVSDIDKTAYNILCLHQAIAGSQVGPANYTFKPGPDVISLKDLPAAFNLIFSGHIHRAQILWKLTSHKRIPIVYPGSIERTSFAEKDEPKGFFLLQVEPVSSSKYTSKLSFNPLPARDMLDLYIPSYIKSRKQFNNWLQDRIKLINSNSIIRFKNAGTEHAAYLQRSNLRSILPEDMILNYRPATYK